MKIFIVAALVATSSLALASGAAHAFAQMAGENPMPLKAAGNATTKPGETLTTIGRAPSAESARPESPLKLPLVDPRLVVSKSKRQMVLHAGGAVVRTYKIALGKNPVDDKVRRDDRATPEGDFYICVKNARSKFYLSFGLSYPNAEDAERGLRDKLITRAQRNAIVRAIQHKRRPPWDTALGGEIFIHGGGTDGDWTWGCVALSNDDIKQLFDALPLGTPVRIEA